MRGIKMEDMLKQLVVELKKLNDTVGRIEARLNKLECDEQASEEDSRCTNLEKAPLDDNVNFAASGAADYIWGKAIDIIKEEITEVSFNTWIEKIELLSMDGDVICLGVPSEFHKGIIECRYIKLLKTALRSITGRDYTIELSVTGDEKKEAAENKELTAETDKKLSSLNPRYSFDTFVVGEHNESAYKHVFKIAENPYNHPKLLYIHGGVGTGKTHLIQAAGNYISEHHTDAKVQYMPIEVFTDEMIKSIRYDNSIDFKEKLLSCNVLLIDDLQFVTGKDATQAEFFKIVSGLLERCKQVIIASTQPPKAMTIMNERFTSMFELGGVFEIKQPDLDTRLEILRRRRAEGNFELSDEELSIIADNTYDNVREILNAFNRMVIHR
jgi:chromosomal replication initiator protein